MVAEIKNPLDGHLSQRNEDLVHFCVYMNIYSRFIHNSSKLEKKTHNVLQQLNG